MNIKIKKGLNLQLEGGITDTPGASAISPLTGVACALCPEDFHGFKPKTIVKEGDTVTAGQAVLFNKDYETMTLVSPVNGTIKAIVRGDRRKILRVEIEPAPDGEAPSAEASPLADEAPEATVDALARAGILARFRQRPFDVVPAAGISSVRDIYVTALDTAPLALSPAALCAADPQSASYSADGARVLTRLSAGKVFIAVDAASASHPAVKALDKIDRVVIITVEGPHPAGLAGTIIANTKPINKGETVWTLDFNTMLRIGQYAATGKYSFDNIVAVTGSEIKSPHAVKAPDGAALQAIIGGELKDDGVNKRIISGNVLTGVKEDADGYLHFPYTQVTVIPEGDDVDEFMGWASLSPSKISAKRSFPLSFLKKTFSPDARLNGGRRAMIMSGEYERYMPLDILPEYLVKAVIAKDIDAMERLGIYEVAPEDFALAEFADTSKLPLQQIIREGLDYLREETE